MGSKLTFPWSVTSTEHKWPYPDTVPIITILGTANDWLVWCTNGLETKSMGYFLVSRHPAELFSVALKCLISLLAAFSQNFPKKYSLRIHMGVSASMTLDLSNFLSKFLCRNDIEAEMWRRELYKDLGEQCSGKGNISVVEFDTFKQQNVPQSLFSFYLKSKGGKTPFFALFWTGEKEQLILSFFLIFTKKKISGNLFWSYFPLHQLLPDLSHTTYPVPCGFFLSFSLENKQTRQKKHKEHTHKKKTHHIGKS